MSSPIRCLHLSHNLDVPSLSINSLTRPNTPQTTSSNPPQCAQIHLTSMIRTRPPPAAAGQPRGDAAPRDQQPQRKTTCGPRPEHDEPKRLHDPNPVQAPPRPRAAGARRSPLGSGAGRPAGSPPNPLPTRSGPRPPLVDGRVDAGRALDAHGGAGAHGGDGAAEAWAFWLRVADGPTEEGGAWSGQRVGARRGGWRG